jgi:hypothetical protein
VKSGVVLQENSPNASDFYSNESRIYSSKNCFVSCSSSSCRKNFSTRTTFSRLPASIEAASRCEFIFIELRVVLEMELLFIYRHRIHVEAKLEQEWEALV